MKKTAIFVLTHNCLDKTILCLKSIRLNSIAPHHIILIDNGSTDGTLEYLQHYAIPKYKNITLLAQNRNTGFSEGNNIAFRHLLGMANSDEFGYISMLNNDTIVTPGWLSSLVECSESADDIGMVGALSNYVAGQQQIKCNFNTDIDINEIANFSSKIREGVNQDRRYMPTGLLIGFCLLMKINVAKELFPIPSELLMFDDNYLSYKALRLGYKLLIDRSTFVFHYGSQTFKNNDINGMEHFKRSKDIFYKLAKELDEKYPSPLKIDIDKWKMQAVPAEGK